MAERISLQRAVAVITDEDIVVRPAQAQVMGALIELGIAAGAIALLVLLFDVLPIAVMMGFLLLALILGPIGALGLVYGIIGTSFLMQREQQTASWQQGFLGMGIGTNEVAPFSRIKRIEVASDTDQELSAGEQQDLIHWDVRVVKDNDRELTVGTVVAARPLAYRGAERANRLATLVAEMAGVEVLLVPVPADPEAVVEAPAPHRRRYRRIAGPTRETD